jgi:hypothetical protein
LGGSQVVDSLSLARQIAMSRGRRVVWEMDAGTNGLYRIMEFKGGTWQPASRIQTLPENIRPDSSIANSTLFSDAKKDLPCTNNFSNSTASVTDVISITFRPDGTTLLSPSGTNSLRLKHTQATNNWFIITVNGVTGKTQVYRPEARKRAGDVPCSGVSMSAGASTVQDTRAAAHNPLEGQPPGLTQD